MTIIHWGQGKPPKGGNFSYSVGHSYCSFMVTLHSLPLPKALLYLKEIVWSHQGAKWKQELLPCLSLTAEAILTTW